MQLPHQRSGMEMFSRALERWARGHDLSLYSYPVREIRAALLGRTSAAKEELAYVVMTRWGLLGKGMSTHELNAIAAGDYHLGRKKTVAEVEA